MSALNFPDNPAGVGNVYVGDNGITYDYVNGKWRGRTAAGTGGGISIGDFGEGFSLTAANKIVTNKLYSTNLTQPTQHYRLEVDTNGVIILPDQSIINGSYMRAIHGSYAGLAAGPDLAHNEESWMWVDADGAWIATKYSSSAYTWKFDNNGNLTIPADGKIGVADNTGGTGGYVKFYGAGGEGGSDNTSLTSGDIDIVAGVDGGYENDNIYGNFNIGNIRLKTSAYTGQPTNEWKFGWDGSLTLPDNGKIKQPRNSNLIIETQVVYNITTITNPGSGYNSNSGTLTSGGSGTGMTVNVNQASGVVDIVIVNNPGTGYMNGDTITILDGNSNATFTIANYSPTPNNRTNDWLFGTDGTLVLPGGSWTKTTNNSLAYNVATKVVWTSTQSNISGAKLTIQVECSETDGVNGTSWETQMCEAVIAVRGYNSTSIPVVSVYGVTHTSIAPLMTFSVRRNPTTFLIEIVGTRTGTAVLLNNADLKIYSVETGTND